jgi:predicted nucleic acid-binding protein
VGGDSPASASSGWGEEAKGFWLTALVDTNVLIRHLTGDPPEMARRATDALAAGEELLLTDVVVAECVYVLESFYRVERARLAELMRSAIAFPSIATVDSSLLLRVLQLYELEQLHFADAYLVASAESTGIPAILSLDRAIDRAGTVARLEP